MIRVLLVHDQVLARDGLHGILDAEPDIEVVGLAATYDEMLFQAARLDPSVMVVDLATPGLELPVMIKCLRLPQEEIPVIILTAGPESVDVARLLRTGARGFIAPQTPSTELVEAVRAVHAGDYYVCQQLERVCGNARPQEPVARQRLARLTARERLVFGLLAAGQSTSQVAAGFGLSPKTVNTHRQHILVKLGLRNNADLARFAVEHKVLG